MIYIIGLQIQQLLTGWGHVPVILTILITVQVIRLRVFTQFHTLNGRN